MSFRVGRFLVLCLSAVFLFSCSSTPAELAARHARRGDEYAQKEKYNEAVIEYRNAVKAEPGDAALRYRNGMVLAKPEECVGRPEPG